MKIENIVKNALVRRKADGLTLEVLVVTDEEVTAVHHGPVYDDKYTVPIAVFVEECSLVVESIADLALAVVDMFDKANGVLDLRRDGSGGHVIEALGHYPSELAKEVDRLRAALVREGAKPLRTTAQRRIDERSEG